MPPDQRSATEKAIDEVARRLNKAVQNQEASNEFEI